MSLIPLIGQVSLSGILEVYRKYMQWEQLHNYPTRYTTYKLEDILLLECWIGKPQAEIENKLDRFSTEMKTWPSNALRHLGTGGINEWNGRVRKMTENRDQLVHTVEAEIIKHKLERVPVYPG
jgi:hypothetical protein